MPSTKSKPIGDNPLPKASDLLRIDVRNARLSPAQRRFNELTRQIDAARARLDSWRRHGDRIELRIANEMLPLESQLRESQRKLVLQIDQLLSGPPLRPRLRADQNEVLEVMLTELCECVLQAEPDPEIEALHDRYADISLAEQRAEDELIDREMNEVLISQMYGAEVLEAVKNDDCPADEMLERAHGYARSRADAAPKPDPEPEPEQAPERPAGRRSAQERRSEAHAERQRQEAREASQSVREVYRRLVRQLHPDRETDPVQHARKTELMQRINRAHADGDLLTLLTLQMEVEQLGADELAELPAQRLAHFNRVLTEQMLLIRDEIRACTRSLQIRLGDPDGPRLTRPKQLDAWLDEQLEDLRAMRLHNEDTQRRLADSKLRRACLNELCRAREMYQRMLDEEEREIDALFEQLAGDYDDMDFDLADFDADPFNLDPFASNPFGPAPERGRSGPNRPRSASKSKRKKRKKK